MILRFYLKQLLTFKFYMMKTLKLLLAICFISLQSCNTIYYQVYEADVLANVDKDKDGFVFEDENCVVQYDLWSEGGDAGFSIYNKTDKTLYLDKYNTHFVINGVAKDYYLDRVFTNNETVAINSLFYNISNESSVSTSYKEKAVIAVPSKTRRKVSEYNINNLFFAECDLDKYPSSRKVRTETYSDSDTPFIFENRISYFFDKDQEFVEVKNAFYVSSVTNYPSNDIISNEQIEECGETQFGTVQVNMKQSPHNFYITYNRK